ncbi:hypothetical protein DMC30DRAFT_446605 [Rhodotorula diobovata]|uniref:HIT-type domain-containing protein n=1 Tax=Rhodotorula diobovata TaxID=5288 RepID=A0A5C5FVX6_9BASI|nr:hypothetical protein DMC30DRAFT_446605 [Rhodotorula diobovata]
MPAKLPACKVCSKADSGKYTCPTDHAPYCSVACFKQHKADGCFSSAAYQPPPRPVVPVSTTEPRKDDDRPRKRLKDLHWPAEPDPTLWDDPLQRDEVKPLRHSELEAVATSPQIRALLAQPSILTPLTRLLSLPHHHRTASLRVLLGLPAEPAPGVYRPEGGKRFATAVQSAEAMREERAAMSGHGGRGAARGGRGRGGARGGRGGAHHGGGGGGGPRVLQSTEEERKEVERFAAQVVDILEDVRNKSS